MALPAKLKTDFSSYPKEVQEIISMIAGEVYLLHETFDIYKHMFMASQKRTACYNKHAGMFFNVFQRLFEDHLILAFTRLLDKDSKGRENVSLWNLLSKLGDDNYASFKMENKIKLDALYDKSTPLRVYRNKLLTHYDSIVCNEPSRIIPFDFVLIETLIQDVCKWINEYCVRFGKYPIKFDGLKARDVIIGIDHLIAKAEWIEQLKLKNSDSKTEWCKFLPNQ